MIKSLIQVAYILLISVLNIVSGGRSGVDNVTCIGVGDKVSRGWGDELQEKGRYPARLCPGKRSAEDECYTLGWNQLNFNPEPTRVHTIMTETVNNKRGKGGGLGCIISNCYTLPTMSL